MSDYKPPEVEEGAGYYYPKDFRILNCYECFEAEGKMCIDENYGVMSQHTGSGNLYNGFCCRPGYNEGYCQPGKKHE